ncbi:sulfite exporter TauE/SafE family protein [Desulforudis sp. 1031]|uniref:sulfite exporter TauE/SafE family protein n=1 Tax=unclassified Candidatus Desulforudis TaxID=2635950 RepID=UPI003CE4C94A
MGKIRNVLGGGTRMVYDSLMAAQRAHARWELETSKVILTKRRKLLMLLTIPVILVAGLELAHAYELPHVIGGKTAYAPSFATMQMFLVSLAIGLCAGMITGCIGAGGGFILTPALMSVGVKGIMSVGTDMFHIFAKAIMGTTLHRKMGNVSVALALIFVIGSITGATVGGIINRGFYEKNPALSDAFISLVYVIILGFLSIYTFSDFLRQRKHIAAGTSAKAGDLTKLARAAQGLKMPPYITFDQHVVPGGRRISVYPVILAGFIIGFIASIMGVGGGFLFFPTFVYGLGVSTLTTVGTDLLQIIVTAGYTSVVQYAVYGFVFYTLAMGLLLGSLVGIQIGAITTKMVPAIVITGFYALTTFAGFVNRGFALPGTLTKAGYMSMAPSTSKMLDSIGLLVFFAIVGAFALWVLASFFANAGKYRRGEIEVTSAAAHGH